MSALASPVQFRNAYSSIVSTSSFSITLVIFAQPLNAATGITVASVITTLVNVVGI